MEKIRKNTMISYIMKHKQDSRLTLLIGIAFLLTGAEYITWWLYKLVPTFSGSAPDLLSEGIGYLFQVLGILLFAMATRANQKWTVGKYFFPLLLFFDLIFCMASFLSTSPALILLFGFSMNLLHGVIAGHYLTCLSLYGTRQNTGKVFGFSYAFGSIGTFLLSSLVEGSLGSIYIFVIYGFLTIAAIAIHESIRFSTYAPDEPRPLPTVSFTGRQILLAGILVVLLSFVKNIGFYFPTEDIITGSVNPILTRCFYGVGLILAGILNDKSRRYGSVCCICALVFPFLALTLGNFPLAGSITWILGYLFFGFFSVYRVVVFSDFAKSQPSALYLAGFGLLFGRIGDSTSSILGILLSPHTTLLIALSTVLFVTTVLVFFVFYNDTYVPAVPQKKNQEDMFSDFLERYQISHREAEVLRIVLEGLSNSEISAKLFISENTVKFHMRNILKKTGCTKRSEVISLYQSYQEN